MDPAFKRILVRIGVVAGAGGVLLVLLFGILKWTLPSPLVFRFESPSSRRVLVVEETCLGKVCSHLARLETRRFVFFTAERRCALGIEADRIVFGDAEVSWSPAEDAVSWEADSGRLAGELDFETDCE